MGDLFEKQAEWLQMRCGKLTASDIWKLMEKGRGSEYFGKGAKTYIKQKVAEILTLEIVNGGRSNMVAMEWGSAHEFEAVQRFEKETGLSVEYYGGANPKFFELDEFSGGSPDGLTTDAIIEVKCPFNSGEHISHLELEDYQSLKDYAPEYYWQMTMNMLVCDKQKGWFISYDNRFADENLQIKIIEVRRDDEDIKLLKERINEAEKQMNTTIGILRGIEI